MCEQRFFLENCNLFTYNKVTKLCRLLSHFTHGIASKHDISGVRQCGSLLPARLSGLYTPKLIPISYLFYLTDWRHSANAYSDEQCPRLGAWSARSIESCILSCDENPECNAFNWVTGSRLRICDLRGCKTPIPRPALTLGFLESFSRKQTSPQPIPNVIKQLTKVVIKTVDRKDAGTKNGAKVSVCDDKGHCCVASLEAPRDGGFKMGFEDTFSGSDLGPCDQVPHTY